MKKTNIMLIAITIICCYALTINVFAAEENNVCHSCGKEVVIADASYCSYCGEEMRIHTIEENYSYCYSCESKVSTDSKFCSYCGEELKSFEATEDEGAYKTVIIVFVIVGIGAIALCIGLPLAAEKDEARRKAGNGCW